MALSKMGWAVLWKDWDGDVHTKWFLYLSDAEHFAKRLYGPEQFPPLVFQAQEVRDGNA